MMIVKDCESYIGFKRKNIWMYVWMDVWMDGWMRQNGLYKERG